MTRIIIIIIIVFNLKIDLLISINVFTLFPDASRKYKRWMKWGLFKSLLSVPYFVMYSLELEFFWW